MKRASEHGLRRVLGLLSVVLILWGLVPGALADYPLEIVELQGRQSDEMIPIIRPLVGADGVVTGTGNKLIVRTSPQRMQQIREVLQQLDRPPRRLMIYVRQGRLTRADLAYAAAGVNLGGDHGRVVAGVPVPADGLGVQLNQRQTVGGLDADQRVQAVEGYPAYIAVGAEVPLPVRDGRMGGSIERHYRGTEYREAATGFYVIPRLNGNQVTLQISTRDERFAGRGAAVEAQRADTRVQGRLGQWIPLGGVSERADRQVSGVLAGGNASSERSSEIHVLVEELP